MSTSKPNLPLSLGKPLHGANVGSTLRYIGKQLHRTFIFMVYSHAFFLSLDLFVFWTYRIHPEWRVQYEAEEEARMDADEQAYKLKRLAEVKMLEAQHANLN